MRISGALRKKMSNDISYQVSIRKFFCKSHVILVLYANFIGQIYQEITRATSDSTALSSKQIEKVIKKLLNCHLPLCIKQITSEW